MKRIFALILTLSMLISLFAASGCSKDEDEKAREYDSNMELFFENDTNGDELAATILRNWGFNIGSRLSDLDSISAESSLDFNELTWNDANMDPNGELNPTLTLAADFNSGKGQIGLRENDGTIALSGEKTERYITDGMSFLNIPALDTTKISDRFEGVDAISMLSELAGAYKLVDTYLKNNTSEDMFVEGSETFSANENEFSAAKRLSLTLDSDSVCKLIESVIEGVAQDGELIKVLKTIDLDEIRDSGAIITESRYFDENNQFVREVIRLDHAIRPTSTTAAADTTTAPADGESTTAKTTANETTTASGEGESTTASDTTTTAAAAEDDRQPVNESYTLTIYHYEKFNQRVLLVSGEYTVLNDYTSTVAAFMIQPVEDESTATTTASSTATEAAGDVKAGKVGVTLKKTELDNSTWELTASSGVRKTTDDNKPRLALSGYLTLQVGNASLLGVPFASNLTVNSFDNNEFSITGDFNCNLYGLYAADFKFETTGKINSSPEIMLPGDTAELTAESRNAMITKLGEKSPQLSKLLKLYSSYYDECGFLRIDKFDVALESSSKDQYIYLLKDLTGFIEEPFKYEFTEDKMISTTNSTADSPTEYDYSKGENEGEIILGGNTYIKLDSSTEDCDVYQMPSTIAEYDKLTLYLYKNGTGVWHYNIEYRIVEETGELLFIYLLSHEMSAATFLMNDNVCYLNAEPFSVISYGFDYQE